MDTKDSIKERIAEICAGGWFDAPDQIHKEYMAWFRGEIEKLELLELEQIEALIRKTFPLFELNEEGEEDRKKATLNLLQAQLDDIKRQLKEVLE